MLTKLLAYWPKAARLLLGVTEAQVMPATLRSCLAPEANGAPDAEFLKLTGGNHKKQERRARVLAALKSKDRLQEIARGAAVLG